MSVYMGQWYIWDEQIISHFNSRHIDSAKFGKGLPSIAATNLLEAVGDTKEGGIERHMEALAQDRRVREFWSSACNRHEKCVQEFVAVKKRVAKEGFVATLV